MPGDVRESGLVYTGEGPLLACIAYRLDTILLHGVYEIGGGVF